MEGKGQLFLRVEFHLTKVERKQEIENYHLVNTTVIIAVSKNEI